MSRVLITAAIDDWGLGPLAATEAVTMALEPLGDVQLLRVKVEEPEQLRMAGGAFVPSKPKPKPAPLPRGGQAPAHRPPQPQTAMVCCYSCGCYRSGRDRDPGGNLYWGTCGRTGKPVYDLKNQCAGWTRLGG